MRRLKSNTIATVALFVSCVIWVSSLDDASAGMSACTCFPEWYNLLRIPSPADCVFLCAFAMEVCWQDHGPSRHNNTMDNKESRREAVSKGVMGLLVGLSLMVAGIWAGRQLHIVWNIWPSTDGVVVRGAVQEVLERSLRQGGNADSPLHTKN